MNPVEIEAAFAAGKIDDRFRHELLQRLADVRRRQRPRSPVGEVIARVHVVQEGSGEDLQSDVLAALRNLAGAKQRPGMVELFRKLHQGAMRNVSDAAELQKVDTPSQVESIVRVDVQAETARAIREIWQPMKSWFDRRRIVIPRDRRALISPPQAAAAFDQQTPLTILPCSPEFAELFGTNSVEQTLALLKRAVEEMGRHFTYAWADSATARQDDMQRAMELMRTLRNTELAESICNGFASGASDVINPLHNLMLSLVEEQRPQLLTHQWQQEICRHHEDFSVFQAMFSLNCLGMLEHVLRVPAASETKRFLNAWTDKWPDFYGKGCPLDCLYDRKYFIVRYAAKDSADPVPIIDFDAQAFSQAEIELISSRTIRLGCPSLGSVHRSFTRAMCEAYFQIVWPQLARQFANS